MLIARDNLLRQQAADRVHDEARLANDIQRQLPGVTRTWALHEAARIVARHGVGVTVRYESHGAWAARTRPAAACTAHHQTTRGRCLNCGHPGDDALRVEAAPGGQPDQAG